MTNAQQHGNRVRFGVFELDLEAGELHKNGLKVKLQDQPYQLLALLVKRPGQIVSREEICQQLWPDGTFVEFDRSLSVAGTKIRDALGDSANSPRFLETVPRRGYRFIAPVENREPIESIADTGRLKNPPTPRRMQTWMGVGIGCAALLAAGALYLRSGNAGSLDSIAVLPFVNGTPAADEYVSDGLTEAIINNLSAAPQLRVIARTTVFHFKGRQIEPQKVGRQLGVDAVLTGKVSQRGDSLTTQIDLVNVATGSQIWGERFQRNIAELQSLQGEMAREIAEKLRLKLAGEERQRLTKAYTANSEAYQLYLKAMYSPAEPIYTPENIQTRIDYLQKAIAKDPNFARAYLEVANLYLVAVAIRVWPAHEAMEKNKEAVRRALELDDGLGEAHLELAKSLWGEWNWAGAEREFKRAIELNTNLAHLYYGQFLAQTGRTQEALIEGQKGIEIDPLSQRSLWMVSLLYWMTRRYDQALEWGRRGDGGKPTVRSAFSLAGAGQYEDAIAEFKQLGDTVGVRGHLAHTYVMAGRLAEARRILKELHGRVQKDGMGEYEIAFIEAALGNKDEAFRWLDKAYEQHDPGLLCLKIDHTLDPLRSDPRFANLVRRVGLPQ